MKKVLKSVQDNNCSDRAESCKAETSGNDLQSLQVLGSIDNVRLLDAKCRKRKTYAKIKKNQCCFRNGVN